MHQKKDNADSPEKNRGLVIVNTGDGKGKTTSALGMALRAAGHKQKVLILQFIKGTWNTGEKKILGNLTPYIRMEQLGRGFIHFKDGKPEIPDSYMGNILRSLSYTEKMVKSGSYDMIILDEIINMVSYGLIEEDDLIRLIKDKPKKLCMVLTGRGASEKIIEIADTVSEMREIKHAYRKGIKARKGIEY
ncbi:MAG: cob(I)yrinic acid a,c-diamide adenosyltransferase [Actinobacteria bacterium]|nr:cob(I)yrinic acid a,c-diamide adenosyltransferase [Actinomycetota bacterium]